MKKKSTLIIACLAVALVITFGVTVNAHAQCCFGEIIGAPIYAAAVVVGGAAKLAVGIVTYPFTACCHVNYCATCPPPPAGPGPG